jgi:hypothetical protein
MADVLADTLTVKVGDVELVFKVPTPREQNKVVSRAAFIRRQDDPGGVGWEEGLDFPTILSYRGMGLMEVLLQKASVDWAFTPDPTGNMVCDSSKFPATVAPGFFLEVYQAFQQRLDEFRSGGAGHGKPPGDQAVEGQPNPGG